MDFFGSGPGRRADQLSRTAVALREALWQEAKAIAAQRGETVTGVITEALRRYVRRNQP